MRILITALIIGAAFWAQGARSQADVAAPVPAVAAPPYEAHVFKALLPVITGRVSCPELLDV